MRRIQYNSETKSFSERIFSANEDVAQIQRILPKLKGAPSKVKAAALLLADYFRPLPSQGFKYGVGINPKGGYPFIALTYNGRFTNFRAFMSEEFRQKIGASSFGKGKYVANDTNVVNEFDENDFIISYEWIIKSDSNISEVIKAILKFINDNPKYRSEFDPIEPDFDEYYKKLRELKEKEGVEFINRLSADSKKMLDELKDELYKKVPRTPEEVIKYKLNILMEICKTWVDKYRGFTDIDLRARIF